MQFITSICLFAFCAALSWGTCNATPRTPSPPSSSDCSTIAYDMLDCVSFIEEGSNDTKPSPSCCTGFKTVVNANFQCVCVALSTAPSVGIQIDMIRAGKLPSFCKVKAPSIKTCSSSDNGSPSPSPSPPASKKTPPSSPAPVHPRETPAPATAPVTPSFAGAPAQSSGSGYIGSSTTTALALISSLSLLIMA